MPSSTASQNSKPCLRPYQQRAVTRAYEADATLLTCPMGAGKTAIVLTALQELLQDRVISRALVLAPLRVAQFVWCQEAAIWTPGLEVASALGPPLRRRGALVGPSPVVVLNYENVAWAASEGLLAGFDALVLDESTKVKSTHSSRWKALHKIARQFKVRIGMTGTPTGQSLLDLYGQVTLLDQGQRWGRRFTKWRDRYFHATDYERRVWVPDLGTEEALTTATRDLAFHVEPAEYLDQLPGIVSNPIWFEMPAAVMDDYAYLRDELLLELENGETIVAGSAGVLVGKLRQLGAGFLYAGDGTPRWLTSARLDTAQELLEELPQTLVCYQFRAELEALQARRPAPYLGSGVSAKDAARAVDAWNAGDLPVLYIHPASAGHGLNLQSGGHHMLWLTLPWSWDMYEQTRARLHRSGQAEPVWEHTLLAADTLDREVLGALQDHADLATRVLAAWKK